MFNAVKKNIECRLCSSRKLSRVFKLGDSPAGNALYESNTKVINPEYPLELDLCENCGHLQLSTTVSGEELFQNKYTYKTGTSSVFKNYLKSYSDSICYEFKKDIEFTVLDIGSNDGTCLEFFKKNNCKVLGIDPANEVVQIAQKKGIPTIKDFFNLESAKNIKDKYGTFNIITSHNTLAHIENLRQVFESVKLLMNTSSIFIFEVGYRLDVIKNNWFDTIYHEHLDYHALKPLKICLEKIGLSVFRVVRGNQQGGSIRIYCCLIGNSRVVEKSVQDILNEEKKDKLYEVTTYKKYYKNLERIRYDLKNIIEKYKSNNKKVVGFGVPTKAATLMTFFKISKEDINYFVDDNDLKQNKFTPIGKIPIYNTNVIYTDFPDLIVIFAWNFADSIIKAHKSLIKSGTKFLIPLPSPRIVNDNEF